MFLNSDDLYDPELPLLKTRAHGGTLTMWREELDSFITVLDTKTSRVTGIILDIPFCQSTVHINIYLPTAGKDSEFMDALATLQATVDEASEVRPTCLLYIKGDANACFSPRDKNKRDHFFQQFCIDNCLDPLFLNNHPTYHHFLGFGESDSSIDVLLSSRVSPDGTPSDNPESLVKILCCKDNDWLNSHHDAIISEITLNYIEPAAKSHESVHDDVPTIENDRHKIVWDDDSLHLYQELIQPVLLDLQDAWLDSSSPSSISLLLQQTNNALTSAAKATQKVIYLNKSEKIKRKSIPSILTEASRLHTANYKELKKVITDPTSTSEDIEVARLAHKSSRAALQSAKRTVSVSKEAEAFQQLDTILTSNPQALFKTIRARKRNNVTLNKLTVGASTFVGNDVGKGFFKSISDLKTREQSKLDECTTFQQFVADHQQILEICKAGSKIPPLSYEAAEKLLRSIKASVIDLYSVSARHYINGGIPAIKHFQLLLNAVLTDINNYAIAELHAVHAIVLYKSHGKDKTSDRSYRTISSCPFIAKCADKYVGLLENEAWEASEAETQFQGRGRSHEHAGLLLTEAINLTVTVSKKPVFCLYLDAKSAFDRALREILIRRMYLDGTEGSSLLFFEERLKNRRTFIEWDNKVMGPIHDQQGVEQGGPNSSDQYKIYNNEQFNTAQSSRFGVSLGNITISSIGQADDSVILSSCFHQLGHLLHLTLLYCKKYKVEMTPEKTQLQVFSPPNFHQELQYYNSTNYLNISGIPLSFTTTAEHVGIIRSTTSGNGPHILQRITAHKRSLGAVLSAGLARRHRGNPAASLRTEKLYGLPVLLSGLGSLYLLESEKKTLSQHYKETLQNLQKLYSRTPESVVYFLGGSLPFLAHLHIRQLSIFAMICRIPGNILNELAQYVLTCLPDKTKSWFSDVREICYQYNLPTPLLLLNNPPSRKEFKETVKLKVLDFWQAKLRAEAKKLENASLAFFKPAFMSLSKPHLLWTTCQGNSYELNKATIQAKYLSGRFRTEKLLSHFAGTNSKFCELHPETETVGDIHHHLVLCPKLQDCRAALFEYWEQIAANNQTANNILSDIQTSTTCLFLQFVLDCGVLLHVIRAANIDSYTLNNILLKTTRIYCYSMYRTRRKQLDQWFQ